MIDSSKDECRVLINKKYITKATLHGNRHLRTFKPIFHWKWGSRWLPNGNEIYTKKKECTWPTPEFCVGTQRHLYSTDWCRGLASGPTQILGLASGVWRRVTQKFCVS